EQVDDVNLKTVAKLVNKTGFEGLGAGPVASARVAHQNENTLHEFESYNTLLCLKTRDFLFIQPTVMRVFKATAV
ncbi:MAG: hypothetical protein KJZ93_10995, partial [Caldilineaceae bacterium]|nr:hypothetical protein [Caldilineaceae bacterium]